MKALNIGLRGKSILLIGSLLLTALLVMGGAIYYQATALIIQELLESTGKSIDKDVIEIQKFVLSSHDDLMVIADTPPIQGIIRARDNKGIDPLTGDRVEYWYAHLEQIFGAFLANHPEYYQLRYLDDKGDEVVRTTRIGNAIKNTPRPELQNMAQYPCFSETIRLKLNEVYYSEVNLSRDRGVLRVPHTPLFRLATPIYDAANAVRGVVVINILADAMFSPARTTPQGTRKYLVNQDGFFLVHPDRAREYGFDLGFGYGIRDEMREYPNASEIRENVVKYHKAEHHVDGNHKIQYDPAAMDRYWIILYEIPESVALGKIYPARNMMLIIGMFIATISLPLITWIFTRKMVIPVLQISKTVRQLEIGDLAARVREDGLTDEIGELASSINRMAGAIEKNIEEVNTLNRITVAASSSLSIDEIARKTLDAILQLTLLKFEKRAAIFVADETSRTLRLVASHGFSEEQKTFDAVVPFGDCLCGMAAETGETIVSARCCDNPLHTRKYAGMTPHGHLIIPLKSGDKVLGVMVLYLAVDTKMTPGELRLYHSIADVLAISLQNALHYGDIDRLKSQLGLILNSLGEGVYGLDKAGICTFMNPAAERMLGYGTGELTGSRLHPITHHTRADGSAYPREECRIYASFRENAVYHVDDEVFWKKDGSSFPVEYTSTPIQDESGTATGAVVVFSDITERRLAVQQLKAAKEFSDELIDSIPGVLFCFTPDDRFLRWNNLLETALEYSGEAVARMQPLEMIAPEDRARAAASIRKTFGIGNAEADLTLLSSGGRRMPCRVLGRKIHVDGLPALLGIAIDITERLQAEQTIQRSNRLLSAINQAQSRFISAVNPHEMFDELLSNLLSTTESEYGFIGEIHRDAAGTPYLKTHAITNIAWNEETRKFFEEHSRAGFEFRNLKSLYGTVILTGKILISNSPAADPRRGGVPQGHPPLHAFLGLPFYSGEEMVGMAGIANRPGGYNDELAGYLQPLIATCGNIIEAHRNARLRKLAEDRIKDYAETLEARVSERTAELESARQTAESATRAKSDFLANMSHELRTPLNSILGFSEIMRDGLAGDVNSQQKEYLNDVWESGRHLLQLINDILDISKIEAGKMELELGEVDFHVLLGEVLIFFREKAARHRISLHSEEADDLPAVIADGRKIKQVLINLLTNALKFTRDGGEVGVCTTRDGGDVRISVWDTGIGIAPEDLGRLFQPFQQLESPLTKKYEGTGLGLHLCRMIIEQHGGRIWVESTPGQGSRFTFAIPIAPANGVFRESGLSPRPLPALPGGG